MVVVNLVFVLVFQKSFCCLCFIITFNYLTSIRWVLGWLFGFKGHSFIFVLFLVIASIHCLILVFFVGFLGVGYLQGRLLYCVGIYCKLIPDWIEFNRERISSPTQYMWVPFWLLLPLRWTNNLLMNRRACICWINICWRVNFCVKF